MKRMTDDELKMISFSELMNARYNRDADFSNVEFMSEEAEQKAREAIIPRKPPLHKSLIIIVTAPVCLTLAGLMIGLGISLDRLINIFKR